MARYPTSPNMITPTEIGKRIGRGTEFVQKALSSGQFPVGVAIRSESGDWSYLVPREAFDRWMTGDILPSPKACLLYTSRCV